VNAGPSCNSAIELYQNNKDGTFKNMTNSLFDKVRMNFMEVEIGLKYGILIAMAKRIFYLKLHQI
jgi:hypothetical protein